MARRGSTTLDDLFERPYRPGVTFGPRISPLRRWGMLLVLALLVGVIVTYWILTDTRRVRAMAEKYLSDLTGGQVQVRHATLSIFEGLRLDGVTLHADPNPARHPDSLVFKAQTFLVKYNPHSILSGRLEATQIIALEPQVFLCENLDVGATIYASDVTYRGPRRWNWQRMVREKEHATTRGAPGPRMKLPELLLRNAQFHYSRLKAGQLMHEKGMMEIEASFRPDDEGAVAFTLQSRGEAGGVGPVVKGTYNLDTKAVAASLENFRFGKDIEVMLPKEVRDWWMQHALAGSLDIPTFFVKPGRNPLEPNKFRIETDLKNVTLKILPEEWLSREEDARLAAMKRSMEFMSAAGLDRSGLVSYLHNQFNPTPIEFDKVAGRFVFTEDGFEVDRVGGWVEGNPFSVKGQAHGYSPLAAARFKIEGHGIRIPHRPRYLNSFPPEVRELYDDLKPEGDGSLMLELERRAPGEKPIVRGRVDIHDGRFVFHEFRYPLRNCRGTITFGWDDKTQMNRVDVHHVRGWGMEGGPNQNRYVDIRGFVAPLGRGPAEYDFNISSRGIASEPAIMSAFPKKIRETLRIFDHPGQGLFPTFKGAFTYAIHRDAAYGAKWRHTVDIDLEDATGQLVFFPYPIESMTGNLRATEDHVTLNDVTIRRGEGTLTVNGIVRYLKDQPVDPQVRVTAVNLPIDQALLGALKPAQREWLEKLGIGGKLSVEGSIRRDPARAARRGGRGVGAGEPEAPVAKAGGNGNGNGIGHGNGKPNPGIDDDDAITYFLRLRLRDGVLWPVDGAFALSDVHADMRLTPNQLRITEATGKRGEATISADGVIGLSAAEPAITLNARAKNLLLDAALYKLLPVGWREGWDQTRPEGTVDLDMSWNSNPGSTAVASIEPNAAAAAATQPFTATIRPVKLSMNPVVFPVKVENVKGEIGIRPGTIELKNLTADRPNKGGTIALSGWVTPASTPEDAKAAPAPPAGAGAGAGAAPVAGAAAAADESRSRSPWALKIAASGVVADNELRAALPPAVAKLLDSLKLEGKFGVDLTKLAYTPAPPTDKSGDGLLEFAGTMFLPGNALDVGVPLDSAKGAVTLAGSSKGDKLAGLTGSVEFDSVNLSGRTIRNLKAQLFKPAAQDAFQIGKIAGDIAGGKISGQVDLGFPDVGPSRFALKLVLGNADIQTLVGDAEKDIKGQLSASLDLEGGWGDVKSRRGRGDVAVSGKEMYRIPLVLGLLQITNLTLPISSPFNEAAARYSVEGERVDFQQVELRASNMLMTGQGFLDFGKKKVDMTFVTDNPNAWKIPFLHELIRGARHELLQIRVSGTIQEPKVKGSMMSTFTTTIDEVLKGDRNGKKK